jgi:hypothetical protein
LLVHAEIPFTAQRIVCEAAGPAGPEGGLLQRWAADVGGRNHGGGELRGGEAQTDRQTWVGGIMVEGSSGEGTDRQTWVGEIMVEGNFGEVRHRARRRIDWLVADWWHINDTVLYVGEGS